AHEDQRMSPAFARDIDFAAEKFGKAIGKSFANGMEGALTRSGGKIAYEIPNNFMRGTADMFEQNGHGSRATRNFWRHMGKNFENGGEADAALTTAADSFRRFTGGAGEGFVDVSNRLGQSVIQNYKWYLKWSLIGSLTTAVIWVGSRFVWNVIERHLKKPRVIINSSKKGLWQRFKNWWSPPAEPTMIFQEDLENRLSNLVESTKNINKTIKNNKKTNVRYRNVLLYGEPGTGKTMFARKLSRLSGLEFVELTGSSFFQENAGITAIDELFAWAKKSKKGLCIFIDEADSLLSKREHMKADSENYRIVNHFLNYLGERSDRFMVVMATNYPQLDKAMERRIDDAIEMPLPQLAERERGLCLYRDEILLEKKQNSKAFRTSVNKYLSDKVVKNIAQQANGFSYGDLHGIINMIKTDVDATSEGLVTKEIIEQTISRYVSKKQIFTIIRAVPAI
ncbi:MAG: AAA family ATPase, partial [Candidatus Babeliales bacterium]